MLVFLVEESPENSAKNSLGGICSLWLIILLLSVGSEGNLSHQREVDAAGEGEVNKEAWTPAAFRGVYFRSVR